MRKILTLALMTVGWISGKAQQTSIHGILRFPNGMPASGWLVRVNSEADLSDRDGSFNLLVPVAGSTNFAILRASDRKLFLMLDSVQVAASGLVVLPPVDTSGLQHLVGTKKGYKKYQPPVSKEQQTAVLKTTTVRPGGKKSKEIGEVRVRATRYAKPMIGASEPASRSVLTDRDVEKMAVRDMASMAPTSSGILKEAHSEELSISGGRASTPSATAGKLTSGEVNDFSKWALWTGESGKELLAHSQGWNLRFSERYTVRIKSADGAPQANILVNLRERGSGKTLWQARTDNTGTAELWRGTHWQDSAFSGTVFAEAIYNGNPYMLESLSAGASGQNILTIPGKCTPVRKLDISFIVDATGSMQDEINYLKAEIEDILKKASDSLPGMDIRTASVFYRDLSDAYVVKSSPFASGVSATQRYIAEQGADGGGDTPEAVDLALDENLNKLDWRQDAHRIAFLVLDAPPHNTPSILERLDKLTREYALRGIRLVPVACSGADKPTEALLRNLALATNGTYVFLTDHSGIGNPHISPTTDKYDVTYLNGLLYRIIYQFAYMPECNTLASGKTTEVKQDLIGEANRKDLLKWSYYPNPTTGILNVKYEDTKGHLYVTDVSGRALLRQEVSGSGTTSFDMSSYPSGVYFLRFEYADDQFVTGRFVVSH